MCELLKKRFCEQRVTINKTHYQSYSVIVEPRRGRSLFKPYCEVQEQLFGTLNVVSSD